MTIKTFLQTVLAAATLMVAVFTATSSAQIVNWTNPTGGFFDVGTNWSSGSAPGMGASATFSIAGTFDVDWDGITGDVVTDDLFVLNGDVTFRSVNSAAGGTVYTYTINDDLTVGIGAELRIGDGNDGMNLVAGDEMLVDAAELRVSRNGSLTAMGATDIGSSVGASGFLNLQNTQFDAVGQLRAGIGENAQGRIVAADETVANTTNVDIGISTTGNGNLEVIGENTIWNSTSELDIGHSGPGNMEIRLGGTVNSLASAIGWLAGGNGSVVIQHTGSRWNVDTRLDIGATPGAVGSLNMFDGGSASIFGTDLTIGAFTSVPGCEVRLSGHGTAMFVNRDIRVGGLGEGLLTINNDASLVALGGIFISPDATVDVGGMIAQGLTADSMVLEGILNLTEDGRVVIDNTVEIDSTGSVIYSGFGIATLDASLVNNLGDIVFNADGDVVGNVNNIGTIESAGSTFNIFLSDVVNSGNVITATGARTRVLGASSGNGVYTGNGSVELLGQIRPGIDSGTNVTGTMEFGGQLAIDSGTTLEIELNGANPGNFDNLSVNGDFSNFDGILNVIGLGSFTPVLGEEFLIVEIDGVQAGQFAGLDQGDLVSNLNGQDLFIDYMAGDGNDISLTTTSVGGILLGDVNLDGQVDLLDVAPFVELLTMSDYQAEADINQDGAVNLLDVGPFVDILVGG